MDIGDAKRAVKQKTILVVVVVLVGSISGFVKALMGNTLVGQPTEFILCQGAIVLRGFMLNIKNRLNTGFDLIKLCSFTSVCTLFAIPMSMALNPGVYGNALNAFLVPIGFELFFFVIFVLPPSLGAMGISYLLTKRRERRIENVGYGYIVGFLVGLLLVILVISPVGALLGLPVIGFCVGLALSFVSSGRENKTRFDSVKGSLLD